MPDIAIRDPVSIPDPSGAGIVGTLWDAGRDAAVVLVHGLVGSRRMPEILRLAEALALGLDVLAIDTRGHGDGPGRFTWGRDEWSQVAAAAAWLAQRGRRAAAVGFSFGGYHVAKAAARGVGLERIALVGAPVDLDVLDHVPFGPDFWRHVPAMLRRRRKVPRCERLPRLRDRALTDGELGAIRAPTLVVHGGADWLILRRHAERYATAIPDARLVVVPDGLHAEYLVDSHPEVLTEALAEFLAPLAGSR